MPCWLGLHANTLTLLFLCPVSCAPCAGGIQRYLEAFPDGGFFKGKNFVFDERVDVEGGSGAGALRRPV